MPEKVWPQKGDKMRFINRNGYPRDLEVARLKIQEGQILTVREFHLGDWNSTILFEEVSGHHNSVMFEPVSLNLYYINGSSADADCSAFVRAFTPKEAFNLWLKSEISGFACGWFADVLSNEDLETASEDDLRIFEVPDTQDCGVINWHGSDGVRLEAFARAV